MSVRFTRLKPWARKIRAVWAVGACLRFKCDASRLVQGNAIFGFHVRREMLAKVELQTGLGRKPL